MNEDFKKSGINLGYLKSVMVELEKSLTELELVGEGYNNVNFASLAHEEKIKYALAAYKAVGFAIAVVEEGKMIEKQLKNDALYGPVDLNKKNNALQDLMAIITGNSDPEGGIPPMGGGFGGFGKGGGGGGMIQ